MFGFKSQAQRKQERLDRIMENVLQEWTDNIDFQGMIDEAQAERWVVAKKKAALGVMVLRSQFMSWRTIKAAMEATMR